MIIMCSCIADDNCATLSFKVRYIFLRSRIFVTLLQALHVGSSEPDGFSSLGSQGPQGHLPR